MEGKKITPDSLARIICKKYKGLFIQDIRTLINVVIDETLELLLNNEVVVDFKPLCRFTSERTTTKGRDFVTGEIKEFKNHHKIRVKLSPSMKFFQVDKNKKILEEKEENDNGENEHK